MADLLHTEGATTRLIACRVTESRPRRLMRWLDIEVDPSREESLLRALQRRVRPPGLAVARLGPGRFLVRLREAAPAICTAAADAGGICTVCPLLTPGDREAWRVVLSRGAETRDFLKALPSAAHAPIGIARVRPYRSRTSLTRRQDLALRRAFELGYFDYPRRGTLADVARSLGTGRSATLEMLRRATAKLAARRYGDELRGRVTPEVLRRGPGARH